MIIKNAIKNLGRNKGRSFLVGIVAGIVMLASACSVVVHVSAKQLASKQMKQIGAQVIITRNDDKLNSESAMMNYREISVNEMKSFTDSSLVKSSAIYATSVGKTSLKTVEGSGVGNGMVPDGSSGNSSDNVFSFSGSNYESPNIILIGSTNEKISDDFVKGIRKIKEGMIYKKAGEVLIGETLANKNNLKVGDSFEVKMIDLASSSEVPVLKLKISGIYEDHKPMGENDSGYLNKDNEVLMNFDTFQTLKVADNTGGISVEGAFHLNNPDDVEKLEAEFHKKGMPEFFELTVNRNAYEKSVAPIIQVADTTKVFSIMLLTTGALIMVALSLLSIRERKYEIGVLRAMGLKKGKISLMLCIEMCTLCLGCGLVALVVAKFGGQAIADMMLSGIETVETIQFGALLVGSGTASTVTNIPTLLTGESIILIVISAVALGLLGSACGLWYITRNEPMKILAERN